MTYAAFMLFLYMIITNLHEGPVLAGSVFALLMTMVIHQVRRLIDAKMQEEWE